MRVVTQDGITHEPDMKVVKNDVDRMRTFINAHYGNETTHVIVLMLKE